MNQALDTAGKKARAMLRQAGVPAKAVNWIRAHNEGEFASVDKWYEERLLEILTHPANATLEFSRETKGQIFVKFNAEVLAMYANA